MAIYKSLAASGRDEAVSIAIEHGLLDDGRSAPAPRPEPALA